MDKISKSRLGEILSVSDDCTVKCSDAFPEEMSLAMAYIPFQKWDRVYESDVALCRGTIFPCLDKPFIGEEAVDHD